MRLAALRKCCLVIVVTALPFLILILTDNYHLGAHRGYSLRRAGVMLLLKNSCRQIPVSLRATMYQYVFNSFILPHVTHLAHFTAGLGPSIVCSIHIHSLCLGSVKKIATQGSIVTTFIRWGLFLFQSLFSFSLIFPHLFSATQLTVCLFNFSTFSHPTVSPLCVCPSFSIHAHIVSPQRVGAHPPNLNGTHVYLYKQNLLMI